MTLTADVADAARLVGYGLRPKLIPARDDGYRQLLRRHRADVQFAALVNAVADGLGLVVLDVSERAGVVLGGVEDSVFAVRMTDYAKRTGGEGRAADRVLHGVVQLAVATLAYPRPADLADDSYVGRVTVEGVDAFVREACRRLDELAAAGGEVADPSVEAPMLEATWRAYSRRTATGATRDARRLFTSTTGMVAKALGFLADQGFLTGTGAEGGGTYRTTPRYQVQVRELAASRAFEELLALGIAVPGDGNGSLRPEPPRTEAAGVAAPAGTTETRGGGGDV
jgi:hypothetical protein